MHRGTRASSDVAERSALIMNAGGHNVLQSRRSEADPGRWLHVERDPTEWFAQVPIGQSVSA